MRHRNFFESSFGAPQKSRTILSQLEQGLPEGGLKLTYVSCSNDALQLAWIEPFVIW